MGERNESAENKVFNFFSRNFWKFVSIGAREWQVAVRLLGVEKMKK